mmetsp:Transcript_39930/g.72808  ORF Transcript_39930/g.72808 Transcript_39930/m.72808 type:complete len:1091 (+) Transcript_39930:210-3482(+)
MSPTADPQLFKGGGGRPFGVRESNQALAELKTKLEFALSRLNDQDTQRTGVEEIREFLQTLYPDWFPMVISCIGEAGTNLKPLGRCESVKLLGLLAELHGEAVVPLLARILQVVVTRLQDADLHLREACAETVFKLARALVLDVESSPVFATLLKPLFGALNEHSKWVQIGAAACICSVIQGSPSSVIRENLGRLCQRLVQHLSLPLAMARPQLLGACIYIMQAVEGADFDEVLPALMPCLESCLNASSDWQTRKQAIEVLQNIGDTFELGQSLELPPPPGKLVKPTPLQRRIALLLEVVRQDKVRAVREAVKDVMVRWSVSAVAKAGPSTYASTRSSSPGASAAWAEREQAGRGSAERSSATSSYPSTAARSSSPTGGGWFEREQARSFEVPQAGTPMGGSAGTRQNRSVRASTREREEADMQAGVGEPIPDRMDAASEKARAIKAALSGAALNSTKKPRPKRERQSIFDGPMNTNFFTQANTNSAGAGADDSNDTGDVMGQAMDDGGHFMPDDDNPDDSPQYEDVVGHHDFRMTEEEEDVGREMRAAASRAKARASPRRERLPGRGTGMSAEDGPIWPDTIPDAAQSAEGADVLLGEDEADALPTLGSHVAAPASASQAVDQNEAESKPTPAVETGDDVETKTRRPGSSVRGHPPARPGRSKASATGGGNSAAAGGGHAAASPDEAWAWEAEPVGPKRGAVAASFPGAAAPDLGANSGASLELLLAQVKELSQRLNSLEEEKMETEERLSSQLHAALKSCESQTSQLAAQKQQLEAQERRLHVQEQHSKLQEQKMAQQEQLLRQQEKRLHEQELQLNQQDQQSDEQVQVLREHEQQMEQIEQQLADQKAVINELLALGVPAAASDGSVSGSPTNAPANAGGLGKHAEDAAARSWVDGFDGRLPSSMLAKSGATTGSEVAVFDSLTSSTGGAGPGAERSSLASLREGLGKDSLQVGPLWEKVLDLVNQQRYLEAYKQVIAEPEESCLLRLMQHTGPIVERLDAESNSRLIRRLIHILSSPAKEPAATCIEQIFAWLWQALDVGIHFTSSQVEDLAAALQKVAAPQSQIPAAERAEASQLLSRVSALRRS